MAMCCVLASALIIVVSMTLQVPFLALSMIAVFFGMQENYALSRMLIIVGVMGVVVAVFASILLLKFTIDYPMLRLLGAGLIGFCGVYLLRVSKPLAAAGFLIALAAVYAQSLVDIINNGYNGNPDPAHALGSRRRHLSHPRGPVGHAPAPILPPGPPAEG